MGSTWKVELMRYYDKIKHNEVFEASKTTLTQEEIPWWFEALDDDTHVIEDADGYPYRYKWADFTKPIVVDGKVVEGITPEELADKNKAIKEYRLRLELDAIVGDLSHAESMYLMLQYGFAKMNPSDAEDDSGVSLTPTGEDIITWGDRLAQELGNKLLEIKSLK